MNPHYHLHPPPRAITAVSIVILTIVVHRRRHRNPTNNGVPAASPCPPPPAIPPPSPSRPLQPLDRPWRCHGPACGMDVLPVQRVECRSLPRLPRRGAGPLRQRRRHCRRNALVSSPTVGGRPSFWPGDGDGSTGMLMVVPGNPAPRRRCHDDDARPSWSSPLSVGIVGVRCGWVVVMMLSVMWHARAVILPGLVQFVLTWPT